MLASDNELMARVLYYDVLGTPLSYLLLSWNMQDCIWCEKEERISGVYRGEQMS
jgi:hypothetical protein